MSIYLKAHTKGKGHTEADHNAVAGALRQRRFYLARHDRVFKVISGISLLWN